MIVPELPEDVRALKDAVGRFMESEVYPFEQRIAEVGSIPTDELAALRAKARAAGFSMLNMPPELGGRDLSMLGQVALEEESGKATNGLGFAVVDRGPRELHEIATPEQIDRYVRPISNGEYREAWALTEPGAGSDLSGLAATALRDGELAADAEAVLVARDRERGRSRPLSEAERSAFERSL
jgi:alkylation response protein AidB-like acyl-CoA dehydrogenase